MTTDWRAIQAEWENPANWRWGGFFYVAPRDPRVWVRKRNPEFGWTLNFAHRQSWLRAAGIVGVPLGLIIWRLIR